MRGNPMRMAIAVAALLALAWMAMEAHQLGLFSRDGLASLRTRFGTGAPLVIIGALVLAVVIGPIPTVVAASMVLGIMGWIGLPLDVATVTIAAVLFGLVVDDTVHLLHHYVSARSSDDGTRRSFIAALRTGAQRGGRMMAMTTVVLALGFLVLCLAHIRSVVWFGLLTSTAISFALLADLVILPAVFAAVQRVR